jgi:hypothetical protein
MDKVTKKRSLAIDMIKGLSIMTLFYLHFENGWMDAKYNFFLIRSPAFYMVVGWLWGMSSNKRTVKEHWTKRKQGLVKPYLWFSLIFLLIDVLLLIGHYIEPFILIRDLYKTVCLRGIGTLWFLPALLGGELLFLSVRDRGIWTKVLLYIICLLILYSYSEWYDNTSLHGNLKFILNAPYRVVQDIANAFIYICTTYYISRHWGKKIIGQNKILLCVLGMLLLAVEFYLLNFSSLIPLFHLLVPYLLGGLGILFFFTSIEQFKPVSLPLTYCGKNSLIIMAMHWELFTLVMLFDKYYMGHSTYSGFITLLYFIVSLPIMYCIIELINRKFKFIIGK